MKLKYILFLILNISFIQFSLCQDLDTNQTSNKILNANASLNDKVYFGGNLSFNIYNGIILAEISPFIGYKLKPKFSTGLGFKYMYIGSISDDISYKLIKHKKNLEEFIKDAKKLNNYDLCIKLCITS